MPGLYASDGTGTLGTSGTSGWFAICPDCGSKNVRKESTKDLNKYQENWYEATKNDKSWCLDCKWEGKFEETLKTDEEYKNHRRTKLIDKILDDKEKN